MGCHDHLCAIPDPAYACMGGICCHLSTGARRGPAGDAGLTITWEITVTGNTRVVQEIGCGIFSVWVGAYYSHLDIKNNNIPQLIKENKWEQFTLKQNL